MVERMSLELTVDCLYLSIWKNIHNFLRTPLSIEKSSEMFTEHFKKKEEQKNHHSSA
jgi:hypothetical protein